MIEPADAGSDQAREPFRITMTEGENVLWRERQTQLDSPLGVWLFIPFVIVALAFAFDRPFTDHRPLNYVASAALLLGGAWFFRLRSLDLEIREHSVLLTMRTMRWSIPMDDINSVSSVKHMPGFMAFMHRAGFGRSGSSRKGVQWAGFRSRSIVRLETARGTFLIGSKNPALERHILAAKNGSVAASSASRTA